MNKTGIPYLDLCWNPGGFGCSYGCPTCWACRQATQGGPTAPTCPDCRAFRVHWHPERLGGKLAPAARKKPAVVGVQFLGDLFDPKREDHQVLDALRTIYAAPQHEFVFLSRSYSTMAAWLDLWASNQAFHGCLSPFPDDAHRWHIGTTCTNQQSFDKAAKYFITTRCRWWVSAEPLTGPIRPHPGQRPEGIILGANNVRSEPFDIAWFRETAKAFREAGSMVYVKQLWVPGCPDCNLCTEPEMTECPSCGEPLRMALHKHPDLLPVGLDSRELPWTLTTKKP